MGKKVRVGNIACRGILARIRKLNSILLNNFRRMFMKFRLVTVLALAGTLSSIVPVQAATVGQNFNVSTAFTPTCVTNNASPAALSFGAYTAFGTESPTPTTTISFKCSRALTPGNINFDTVSTDSTSSSGALTATAGGVVAGLQYTLAVAAAAKTTTGSAATASAVGSADVYTYTITGAMASGQAGCNLASIGANTAGDVNGCSATQTRTLTIVY
jgi:hypothetical protein